MCQSEQGHIPRFAPGRNQEPPGAPRGWKSRLAPEGMGFSWAGSQGAGHSEQPVGRAVSALGRALAWDYLHRQVPENFLNRLLGALS